MDYDSFVASPALAVERQRAWVAFMAAQVVACDDAASFHDVLGAVDLMLAEWDKRFAPTPESSKLGADLLDEVYNKPQ
jgi:hypothetical protein